MAWINRVTLSDNDYIDRTENDVEVSSEEEVRDYLTRRGRGEYVWVKYYYDGGAFDAYSFAAWLDYRDVPVDWEKSQMKNAHKLWEIISRDLRKDGPDADDLRRDLIRQGYNYSLVMSLSDSDIMRTAQCNDASEIDDLINPDGKLN